ncbi:oligosaccharide flippase family protein [Vibrio splendidus]
MNKDLKVVAKNFIYILTFKGANVFIPLITMPYLIKTIGIEKFGLLAFSLSFAAYFGAVIQYGFNVSATREVARNREHKKYLNIIFTNTFNASLILSFICTLFYIVLVFIVPDFNLDKLVYFSVFAFIVINGIYPSWLFQGIEKIYLVAQINLITRVFYVFSLFVFVNDTSDYIYVYLLNSIFSFFSLIVSLLFIKFKFKIRHVGFCLRSILNIYRSGFPAFLTQLAPNLYNNTAIFLLGVNSSHIVVGSFNAASSIVEVFITVGRVASTAIYPYLCRNDAQYRFFSILMLCVGLILSTILIFGSYPISNFLFDTNIVEISFNIKMLSIGVFFAFAFIAFNTNYLMLNGKDKIAANIVVITSILSFVASVVLIPKYGFIAAIIVIVLTRGVMAFSSYIYYKIHKNSRGVF